MKVLVSDKLAAEGLEIFKAAEGIEVDYLPELGCNADELAEKIGEYEGLAIRSGTKVTRKIIDRATKLKVVGRAGIGVDNVDLAAASERGIVVMNTPGGNTVTTAEHSLTMMMALARHIPQANASMKAGQWEKSKFQGAELSEKTLGVIGLGNIGQIVANRAGGLKMKVIAFDPFISTDKAARLGVELVELDALFARSDFITLHTPKTKDTENIINAASIAKMKDGVRIINCARGGLVNEQDLADAVESGKVAGAATDVFLSEPPPADHPFLKNDRIICTPHLGASTGEAQVNVAIDIARQICAYLIHNVIQNSVNVPSISPEELKVLGPFLRLAENLGSFMGQYVREAPEKITLAFDGAIAEYNTAPLKQSALKGLLKPVLPESVNYVNAPVVAANRGIAVIEQKSTIPSEYRSSITIKLTTKSKTSVITGSIFGTDDPRIVKINDFYLEVIAEGNILVISNVDVPGVVGNVGALLGNEGVNIAGMQLGRHKEGGDAIFLIRVDQPIGDEILEKIRRLPNVNEATEVLL